MMVVTLIVWSCIVLALVGVAVSLGTIFPIVSKIVWCVLQPAMIIAMGALILRRLK